MTPTKAGGWGGGVSLTGLSPHWACAQLHTGMPWWKGCVHQAQDLAKDEDMREARSGDEWKGMVLMRGRGIKMG